MTDCLSLLTIIGDQHNYKGIALMWLPMMFAVRTLVVSNSISAALVFLVVDLPGPALSHPQCLDFAPPYDDQQISYCTEYDEFGCCWRVTDRRARKRVDYFLPRVSDNMTLINQCRPYLRNISCTFCNPYAAHIYDVEGGGEARAFPWLCRSYCQLAYQNCHAVLLRMFKLRHSDFGVSSNPSSREQLIADSQTFCSQVIREESPYCYPQVLDGPNLGGDEISSTPTGDLGCVCAKPVATGLRNPLTARHSGDGTGRLFIIEQLGVIRVLSASNTLLQQPFLDIRNKIFISTRRGDERGLLGLAFHPNYRNNGKFYIYYSTLINGVHHSRLSEVIVSQNDANVADGSSERELLIVRQPASNHNGGDIFFHDGYLYISLGDGGGAGDQFGGATGNGQDKSTLLGSILRIDVDHIDSARGTAYAIPPDNPFVGVSGAQPEIYAYGLRNVWRCSVDRGDRESGAGRGRIFCGDVGQGRFEEIDIIVKGGNYGWRAYEGHECFRQSECDQLAARGTVLQFPIDAYGRDLGVSVTGGYVYRGCLFPNLRGFYIYGDYGSGRLFALRENVTTATWERQELCMGGADVCTGDLVGVARRRNIVSFGEDEDGEVYILAVSDATPTTTDGVVYQLVDPARRESPVNCRGVRNRT